MKRQGRYPRLPWTDFVLAVLIGILFALVYYACYLVSTPPPGV